MLIKDLRIYEHTQVRVFLRNGWNYTGQIEEFLEGALKFKDKFGKIILIAPDEVSTIAEYSGVPR